MKILKALVPSDDGEVLKVDVIKHDGSLWLVPQWIDMRPTGRTRPRRIILLDLLEHQKLGLPDADYIVNGYIPKAILNCQIPPEEAKGFLIVDKPEIEFPGGVGLQ